MIEMSHRAIEIAGFGKGAEMQLIQNDLFPSPPPPAEIVPLVGLGIDDLAPTVDPFRLTTRRGIGEGAAVDDVTIAAAGPGGRGRQHPPAFAFADHRNCPRPGVLEAQRHGFGAGRPQSEANPAGGRFGAKGQLMPAAHRLPPPAPRDRRRRHKIRAVRLRTMAGRRSQHRSVVSPAVPAAAPG